MESYSQDPNPLDAAEHNLYSTEPPSASHSKPELTFTSAPYTPQAKKYFRHDYSHSTNELMKMDYENTLMLKKLINITSNQPTWVQNMKKQQQDYPTKAIPEGHARVNRDKEAVRVAMSNSFIAQRLAAIETSPSKDFTPSKLAKEHQQALKYRSNCSKFRPNPALLAEKKASQQRKPQPQQPQQ